MKLTVILFSIATCLSVATGRQTIREETLKQTLPVYAMLTNIDVLNSTECKRDLKTFHEGLLDRKLWSINLLDANGQPGSGFLNGNNFWISSRDQCDSMRIPQPVHVRNISTPRDTAEEIPPFELHYFVANLLHNSPMTYSIMQQDENVIVLGLCLPKTCTTDEIAAILSKIGRERTLLFGELYSTDIKLLEVKDLRGDDQWHRSGFVVGLGLVVFLMLMLIIGATIYEAVLYEENTELEEKLVPNKNADDASSDSKCEAKTEKKKILPAAESQGVWRKALLCFSAYKNTNWVFDTKKSPDSIQCIDGIRFFGMFWMLTVHTMLYTAIFNDNRIHGAKLIQTFLIHLMSQVVHCVDTFFFISGFLMSRAHFQSAMSKPEPKVISYRELLRDYFRRLFKRYIRLTPPYAFVLILVTISFAWQKKVSMFYFIERLDENCPKYWWGNILYLNNLFPRDKMCMTWSWYLACDMQFYVITSALLVLSSAHFALAVALLCVLFAGTTVISGYTAYLRNYSLSSYEIFLYQEDLYFASWVRIGPYIVGVITGYIVVKLNNKLNLSKKAKCLCWCLGGTCTFLPMIIEWRPQLSVLSCSIFYAVSRTLWSIGSAWLVIACCTNNGGIFARILSFKGWVPPSKLSFCAYLLNPYIIMSIFLNSDHPAHVDMLMTTIFALGINVISYLLAYIFAIMAELPYRRLVTLYMNSGPKKL